MHRLDELVKEMLEAHTGGEVFFDHLDEAIRTDNTIIDTLLNKIPNIEDKKIIVSGGFGLFFRDYLKLLKIKPKALIWVRGGLRNGHKPEIWNYYLKNQEFVFIDDSFYSGRTRNVINDYLAQENAKIVDTYVVYDGSHIKEENVYSLYRYHK